jgi:hypothetical protein
MLSDYGNQFDIESDEKRFVGNQIRRVAMLIVVMKESRRVDDGVGRSAKKLIVGFRVKRS